jgi:hypothetical protein
VTFESTTEKGMVKIYIDDLTETRAATGAFGLTTALPGVVARSISN